MDGETDDFWGTLGRICAVMLVCAVCIPLFAVTPVVFGLDSLFVTLAFGTTGLGAASALVLLFDAELAAAA